MSAKTVCYFFSYVLHFLFLFYLSTKLLLCISIKDWWDSLVYNTRRNWKKKTWKRNVKSDKHQIPFFFSLTCTCIPLLHVILFQDDKLTVCNHLLIFLQMFSIFFFFVNYTNSTCALAIILMRLSHILVKL